MGRPPKIDIREVPREFATVDGIRVGYLLTGTGPPVLLLHGFGEFIETWAYNIDALSRQFTVYAVDLPGHGLSEQPRQDYTFGYSTDFVARFMETLGIRRASLVGRSMGGPICLGLAADHPDRANRVVLVSSGGFDDHVPLPYRLAMLPILGDLFLGPSALVTETTARIAMRRQFYNPDALSREWVRVACQYLRLPHRNATIRNIVRANASLTSSRARVTILDRLPRLQTPTLIIHGVEDNLVPVAQARAAARMIPDAELKLLDRCGHNPQIERATEFNESVVSFLSRGS